MWDERVRIYSTPGVHNNFLIVGVAIRVHKSGSCHIESWVFGYMGWPEPDLFNKRVRNFQPEHDMFIKQVNPTQHV